MYYHLKFAFLVWLQLPSAEVSYIFSKKLKWYRKIVNDTFVFIKSICALLCPHLTFFLEFASSTYA